MPERSNGAVSKTVDPVRDPGVRIPLSPRFIYKNKKTTEHLNVQWFLVSCSLKWEYLLSKERIDIRRAENGVIRIV